MGVGSIVDTGVIPGLCSNRTSDKIHVGSQIMMEEKYTWPTVDARHGRCDGTRVSESEHCCIGGATTTTATIGLSVPQ
jgi:hypothetical protein